MNTKIICTLFLLFFGSANILLAQARSYKGNIGKYKIQMELQTDGNGAYKGRYKYDSKQQWIQLGGNVRGAKLHLNEAVSGVVTGKFELVKEGDHWAGIWRKSAASPPLSVQLKKNDDIALVTEVATVVDAPANSALPPAPTNASNEPPVVVNESRTNPKQTSANTVNTAKTTINGNYIFKSDTDNSSFPEDSKYDVPFGTLDITVLKPNSIHFDLQYNSGYPHYHLASMVQEAVSNDGGKTYNYTKKNAGVSCSVSIILLGNSVQLIITDRSACGFGAHAQPEGVYQLKK